MEDQSLSISSLSRSWSLVSTLEIDNVYGLLTTPKVGLYGRCVKPIEQIFGSVNRVNFPYICTARITPDEMTVGSGRKKLSPNKQSFLILKRLLLLTTLT